MALTPSRFIDAMHDLIDGLEDIQADTQVRLVESLGRLPDRAWLRLVEPGAAERLSSDLATTTLPPSLPDIDNTAKSLITRLADRALSGSTIGQRLARRAVARTASLISDRLTTSAGRVRRLAADLGQSSALLRRIRDEVAAPLQSARAWGEIMNAAVGSAANDSAAVGAVRLQDQSLSPDEAYSRIGDQEHTWVCAMTRTCPDCLPRHGSTATLSEWRDAGTPRSGWSVCGGHCQCQLVPAVVGREVPSLARLAGPALRAKMSEVSDAGPRQASVRLPDGLRRGKGGRLTAEQRAELQRAYRDDIRVRRAFRLLGEVASD